MTTNSPIDKKKKKSLLEINPMAFCLFNKDTKKKLSSDTSGALGLMLQPIPSRWFLLTAEEKAALVGLGFHESEPPEAAAAADTSVAQEIEQDCLLAASCGQVHAVATPVGPPPPPSSPMV